MLVKEYTLVKALRWRSQVFTEVQSYRKKSTFIAVTMVFTGDTLFVFESLFFLRNNWRNRFAHSLKLSKDLDVRENHDAAWHVST